LNSEHESVQLCRFILINVSTCSLLAYKYIIFGNQARIKHTLVALLTT